MPTPQGVNGMHQQPNLWQSYMTAHRGNPFGAMPGPGAFNYLVNTYNPGVNQTYAQTMAGRRTRDAGFAIGGGAADVLASTVAGAAMAGPFGAVGGLAAGLMMPSVSAPFNDRIRQTRSIQQGSMPNVISGSDVSRSLHQGFSAPAAQSIDSFIRKSASTDMVFKEEDYRSILKQGGAQKLFDFSGNAEQYKQTMKTMVGNAGVMMSTLEAMDLESLMPKMKRLLDMGAKLTSQPQVAAHQKTYARTLGLSVDEAVETFGKAGAMIYSQMGMTPIAGELQNMASGSLVEIRKRLGLISPAELARQGGVSGMAQNMTQSMGQMNMESKDYTTAYLMNEEGTGYDQAKLAKLMSGKISQQEVLQLGGNRLKDPGSYMRFAANKDEVWSKVMEDQGPQGMIMMQKSQTEQWMDTVGLERTRDNYMAGMKMRGVGDEQARQWADIYTNPEAMKTLNDQYRQTQSEVNRQKYEKIEAERGITTRFHKWRRGATYEMFGKPWDALASKWSEGQEHDELKANGVTTTGTYVSGINYDMDSKGLTQEEKDKYLKEGPATLLSKEAMLDAGVSEWDKMRFFSGTEARTYYQNVGDFAEGRGLTTEQRESAAGALKSGGVNYREAMQGFSVAAGEMGNRAFTDDRMTGLLVAEFKRQGKSDSEARKLAQDPSVRKAATYSALSNNKELGQDARIDHAKFKGRIAAATGDEVIESEKAVKKMYSDLTTNTMMGAEDIGTGFDNKEAQSALAEALKSDGGSVHAGQLMLVAQLGQALDKGTPGSTEYKQNESNLRMLLAKQGKDEGQIEDYLEGRTTDAEGNVSYDHQAAFKALAGEKGMEDDTKIDNLYTASDTLSKSTIKDQHIFKKRVEASDSLVDETLTLQQKKNSYAASGLGTQDSSGEVSSSATDEVIKASERGNAHLSSIDEHLTYVADKVDAWITKLS
jgi:hypothetical protein